MSKIPGVDPLIVHEVQQLTQKQAVQPAQGKRIYPDLHREGRQSPDRQQVAKKLKKLNGAAEVLERPLLFKATESNGKILIQVLDRNRGRVLREVPPERVMEVAKKLEEVMGLLFDALF